MTKLLQLDQINSSQTLRLGSLEEVSSGSFLICFSFSDFALLKGALEIFFSL